MSPLNDSAANATWSVHGLPVPPSVLHGHRDAPQIHSAAFLSDGKRLIGGSHDESVRAWKLEDGCQVGTLIEEEGQVYAIAASSDGQWVATEQGNTLTIWNAKTDGKVIELKVQVCPLSSLDLGRPASGSDDGVVVVWGMMAAGAGSHSLGFAPNGDNIVGCDARDLRIWNSCSGQLVIPPEGKGQDGCTKFFDSQIGSLPRERKRRRRLVHSIAVSPNAKFIASGSWDHQVRVSDTATYTQIDPNLYHDDQVDSVSPHDIYLDGGRYDEVVRIWSVKDIIPSSLGNTHAPPALSFHVLTHPPDIRLQQVHQARPVSPVQPSLREAQDSQSIRDDDESKHSTEKVDSEDVDVALWRQPHGPPSRPYFPDVSSASMAAQESGRSRSHSKVNSPAAEQQIQDTTWPLDDIRSMFSNDLTGYATREGEGPIASGSYGDIYRGALRVSGMSINVAVKAIRTYSADDGNDEQKIQRLRQEIRVWVNLEHINVLPLFGTVMGFGRFPAMVCPWLENGPLTSYLERERDSLSAGQRLALAHDVAMGLQYLHSQSVVHGDLSGSNVLIHANGRACIADAGLSTLLTALGGPTFVTSFGARGTLRWAATELLDLELPEDEENPPQSKVVPTPGSDIYSFGGIMLQILTGRVPYHYYSRDEWVLLVRSKGETPKRPDQALVTQRQWAFIERCWASVGSRPSSDEIVDFTRNELIQAVLCRF